VGYGVWAIEGRKMGRREEKREEKREGNRKESGM
jgi:hypothetical protein